ncbi:hypothetical protein CEK25_006681 [Fusarium fujikuroi]|nr:hypothetical protein CEK25_006681 [Fusarium fujikuroi]
MLSIPLKWRIYITWIKRKPLRALKVRLLRARGFLIFSYIYKRSIDKVRDSNRNILTVMYVEWRKLADWYAALLKSRFKL